MQLYDYVRSTASYRVRIALNIKGLDYQAIPVHLLNGGGEQFLESYSALNPQHLVPTLVDEGVVINQSLAIIDYLEQSYPTPPLLPSCHKARANVQSLSLAIACDIHPLNNLRVLTYLTGELGVSEAQKLAWYRHWVKLGFDAIEQNLANIARSQAVCVGDTVTLADLCLIPQVYNARRFDCPLENYPLITKINDYCLTLAAFSMDEIPEK